MISFNRFTQFFLGKFGVRLFRIEAEFGLRSLADLINSNIVCVPLQRLGSEHDGGYLVPLDMDNIEWCISAGVSNNMDFEQDLLNFYDIKSILIDGTVDPPSNLPSEFVFLKKMLRAYKTVNSITLGDCFEFASFTKKGGGILKIDIEGGEYEIFTCIDTAQLELFQVIVVEFHDLDKLAIPSCANCTLGLFSKILDKFFVCHLHPNNASPPIKVGNSRISQTVEITFVRKDRMWRDPNLKFLKLPHPLDARNDASSKDYNLYLGERYPGYENH